MVGVVLEVVGCVVAGGCVLGIGVTVWGCTIVGVCCSCVGVSCSTVGVCCSGVGVCCSTVGVCCSGVGVCCSFVDCVVSMWCPGVEWVCWVCVVWGFVNVTKVIMGIGLFVWVICVCCPVVAGLVVSVVGDVGFWVVVVLKVVLEVPVVVGIVVFLVVWVFEEFWGGWPS